MILKQPSVLFVFLVTAGIMGCSTVIRPHVYKSEFLNPDPKINARVELYLSENFRTHYHRGRLELFSLHYWNFELGDLAVDAFRYALGSRFSDVDVKYEAPSFPLKAESAEPDLVIAIEPEFERFRTRSPFLVKSENHGVNITFSVTVYDESGSVLIENIYRGIGRQQGALGSPPSGHAAYPVAAAQATIDAVDQAVQDILAAIETQP